MALYAAEKRNTDRDAEKAVAVRMNGDDDEVSMMKLTGHEVTAEQPGQQCEPRPQDAGSASNTVQIETRIQQQYHLRQHQELDLVSVMSDMQITLNSSYQ